MTGEFCCFCQKPITGQARKLDDAGSMSGAKPDQYAHPGCGPRTMSIVHRAPRPPQQGR